MVDVVYRDYFSSLVTRLRTTYLERRREDIEIERRLLAGDDSFRTDSAGESRSTSQPTNLANLPLKVTAVTFYTEGNGKHHRTSKFQLVERGTPILRRGQTFFIAVAFGLGQNKREYDPNLDEIRLLFTFGPQSSPMNGTQQVVKVDKLLHTEESRWAARIKGYDKNAVTIEVRSSPDSCVGIWQCQVERKVKIADGENISDDSPKAEVFAVPDDIYFLFNPWELANVTYMKDKELLDEYVLEESGKIWVGPHTSTRGRHWIYGQFDDSVLPLAMILLERSGLAFPSRGNPILVSKMFYRAIGIPCRVVSNLVSAHDANGTLTIDRYFDDKNSEIEYDPHNPHGGKDSIWNFHAWNDVWFARPDLPKGYGGWQAIDFTPQEQSDGLYQCGPASLEAVRKGRVGYAYDVPFVLAEVNGDLVRWRQDKSSDFGFIRMEANKYHVGRQILTKMPNVFDSDGDSDRQDIIEEYKAKEGTRTERLQLVNAVRGSNRQGAAHFFELSPKQEDMEFDLIELEQVPVGEPFSLVVKIINKANETRTVQADLVAESVYYTGVRGKVKKATGKFVVRPNSNEELRMTVQATEYMDKLVEYGIMNFFAICAVDETQQALSEEDDFQVVKPPLAIEVSSELKVGKPAYITFSFVNPIKHKLTKYVIHYEGPFASRFSEIKQKDVEVDAELRFTHRFIPRTSGSHRLVGTFTSKELIDIIGSAVINVA